MPIVSTWWRQTVAIDTTTSDAGLNAADPAIGTTAGASTAEAFFSQLQRALSPNCRQRITSGVYDGDPAAKALAIETLASGRALSDSLGALIIDAGTASAVPAALCERRGTGTERPGAVLQQTLAGLGVPASPIAIPLPTDTRNRRRPHHVRDVASPAQSVTLSLTNSSRTGIGDVEVGAVYTSIDQWDADTARGSRLAATIVVRIPTGTVASPTDPFGATIGAGTPAVGIGAGIRPGPRDIRRPLQRRITCCRCRELSPGGSAALLDGALPSSASTADVTVNPGDQLRLAITPYFRLARDFGVVGSATWITRRATDDVQYAIAADSVPGRPGLTAGRGHWCVTAAAVDRGHLLVVGSAADGTGGIPLDAGWRWETTVASSGGIATKWSAIIFFAGCTRRLW